MVGVAAEAQGVVALALERASGAPLPRWAPGAHVDVHLPSGCVRQYSLCGEPGDRDRYRIAVLREERGRGGSREVHDRLLPGTELAVAPPRNNFPLVRAAGYLFIAGGIGITPLLPMVRAAAERRADWRLVYGGRSVASMAFVDELLAIDRDRVELVPEDTRGLIDVSTELESTTAEAVYCCGPESLLAAVHQEVERLDRAVQLHLERFSPTEVPAPAANHEFEVVLARSGERITVPPDRSILDVALDHGVPALYSCCEGTCGTCVTRVLDGEVDHRDSVLSPAEREAAGLMAICVSRARGNHLELEL